MINYVTKLERERERELLPAVSLPAKKDLILVGAGGFEREVLWQVGDKDEFNVLGFVDDNPALAGSEVDGATVLGNEAWLVAYPHEVCVAICVAKPAFRKAIHNKLSQNPKISFPTIVAKGVIHSNLVSFGQGCIICTQTIITTNVTIGDFVIINPNCNIAHDVTLGDFTTLYYSVNVAGNVHIGSSAEIGTATTIIQNKSVGENSIIGAGAVITRSLPSNCTAVGVPATPIKYH